jgi:putative hydrolase of HD superfamily
MSDNFEIDYIRKLVHEAYIPFAEEERSIAWPNNTERRENDAEHSYSLALIGMALGEQLGMDPAKIAYYATIHDLPELYAGDTSVWDDRGRETKIEREAAATEKIGIVFSETPVLKRAIEEYEEQADEESRFVYALDKLLAVIMIVEKDGYFWKSEGISFEEHREKAVDMMKKVSAHPIVLQWYQELLDYIVEHRQQLFDD